MPAQRPSRAPRRATSNPPLAPPRGPTTARRRRRQNDDLQGFVTSTPAILAPMSRRVAERCDVESPQDAVAALEARAIGQGDQ